MSRTAAEYMRDFPPPSPRQWLPKCRECGGHGADPLSDNVNWLPCKSCGGSGVETSADTSK